MSPRRLVELLGALSLASLATNGTNGAPPETALHAWSVAVSLGRASGVPARPGGVRARAEAG